MFFSMSQSNVCGEQNPQPQIYCEPYMPRHVHMVFQLNPINYMNNLDTSNFYPATSPTYLRGHSPKLLFAFSSLLCAFGANLPIQPFAFNLTLFVFLMRYILISLTMVIISLLIYLTIVPLNCSHTLFTNVSHLEIWLKPNPLIVCFSTIYGC